MEDCNGHPVQNGYLKGVFRRECHIILRCGEWVVNSTVVNCNPYHYNFSGVDIDALIQGDPMTLSAATEIDLGTITACGNIADFLKVEVADLGLDTTLLSGVSFINGNSFTEINAGNGIDSSTQIDFHLYWQDNTPNIVKPGTYNFFPNEHITAAYYTCSIFIFNSSISIGRHRNSDAGRKSTWRCDHWNI
ncbi:MAG: hypothetical protein IPN55_14740 [Saprospiraceae bacterium]|nr:hypothetical protein [Candidatus Brachybacter algidus]